MATASKNLRTMLEQRLGREIKTSKDCELLSADIDRVLHETLGVTTLKRFFGLANDPVAHRSTTMEVIAKYLGFATLPDLLHELGDYSDISTFEPVDSLDIENLPVGSRVKIAYNPGREIQMTYNGKFWFMVTKAIGCKLYKGDEIHVTQLANGFDLYVYDVVRDGVHCGPYHSAKNGGLTLIEVE